MSNTYAEVMDKANRTYLSDRYALSIEVSRVALAFPPPLNIPWILMDLIYFCHLELSRHDAGKLTYGPELPPPSVFQASSRRTPTREACERVTSDTALESFALRDRPRSCGHHAGDDEGGGGGGDHDRDHDHDHDHDGDGDGDGDGCGWGNRAGLVAGAAGSALPAQPERGARLPAHPLQQAACDARLAGGVGEGLGAVDEGAGR
eukprot:229873-Rhodomonas_salina.1